MRISATLFSLALLIPSLTFAAAFGFPREPLWLSSSTAREGEIITMYAAVYNSSANEMKGSVSFSADDTVFDTKEVQLPVGGSSLITASWKAVKGSHALSASFVSGEQKDATSKIAVTITAAPPPPPKEPTAVDKAMSTASDFVGNMTSSVPIVGTVADAVVGQTEKVRTAGADFFEPYAKPKGAATSSTASGFMSAVTSPDSSLVSKGMQMAAAAALFAFDTKWLFYGLALLLFYLILRTMKRWVNRPRF